MAKPEEPRSVVITGASSGIGRALAVEYARRGAHVVVAARREAELVSLCEQLRSAGGRASPLVCDVADATAAFGIAKRAEAIVGSIDMIVANAGVDASSTMGARGASASALEGLVRIVDVNVRGAMATLLGAIPIMLGQRRGHLVGVSSLAGRRALPGAAAYSASKAALSTFLEGLWIDLTPAGLRVTDVQPGFVDTPMTATHDFSMPFLWDAAKAARYVAARLERGPARIAFPLPLRFMTRLSQLVPLSLHAFMTTAAKGRARSRWRALGAQARR